MANKRINDLQARSSADDSVNIAGDDASQTWRITLAQVKAYIQTAIAPITTLGDLIYGGAAGAPTRLAGNTTATRKVLAQTGTGSVSAAPAWTAPWTALSSVVAKTADYTATIDDDIILCSGAVIAITLPTVGTSTGKKITVKKTDSSLTNIVTIGSIKLNTVGETATFCSDGTTWHLVGRHIPGTWESFTPTGSWTTNTTYRGRRRRVGKNMEFEIGLTLAGAPTAAALTLNLGLTLDTADLAFASPSESNLCFGYSLANDASGDPCYGAVNYSSTTVVALESWNAAGTRVIKDSFSATAPFTFATGDAVHAKFSVPVSGWTE